MQLQRAEEGGNNSAVSVWPCTFHKVVPSLSIEPVIVWSGLLTGNAVPVGYLLDLSLPQGCSYAVCVI